MKRTCVVAGNGTQDKSGLVSMLGQFEFLRLTVIPDSSQDLIDYLYNHPTPDVIFIDADLPGLSNPAVATALSLKPLIIMTRKDQQFSMPRGQLFIVGYLYKPFCFEQVMHILKKMG